MAFLVAIGLGVLLSGAPTRAATYDCGPCAVIFFGGQSNMVVASTSQATPPDATTYNSVFTGSIAPTPLGPATLGISPAPAYGAPALTLAPSASSGTLTVTSVASGTIHAGQALTCAGCAPGTVVASDQFGSGGGTYGPGTYVVTPAQTIAPGTLFTARQPNIAGESPGCMMWSVARQAWEVYVPAHDAAEKLYNSNGPIAGTLWGPEGAFCLAWLADHPGQTLFMVKYARGGQSLCPSSGTWSPEVSEASTPNYIANFGPANVQMTNALAALPGVIGAGNSWRVEGFVWVQGERDGDLTTSYCNDPYVYQTNLIDLVNQFANPSPTQVHFTGSIKGVTLTVTATTGRLGPGQYVSGRGAVQRTYIARQLGGAPGGVGTYALQVYQNLAPETITDVASGATVNAAVSGWVFGVNTISGGAIGVKDTLSGPGLAKGTFVQAFGSGSGAPGSGGVGWYQVNVNQTLGVGALTASSLGWGAGADTARFVIGQSRNYDPRQGVQVAQAAVNNAGLAKLSITVVNRYDARPDTAVGDQIHDDATFIAEDGRRLYLAWKANTQAQGGCDLTTPTC